MILGLAFSKLKTRVGELLLLLVAAAELWLRGLLTILGLGSVTAGAAGAAGRGGGNDLRFSGRVGDGEGGVTGELMDRVAVTGDCVIGDRLTFSVLICGRAYI